MKSLFLSLGVAFFPVAVASGLAAPPTLPKDDNVGITINQTDGIVYPAQMQSESVKYGEARVAISVDREGRLTDCLITGYTDRAFADAAFSALKRWRYDPARVHGRTTASRVEVLFVFRDNGVIVQSYPGISPRRMIVGYDPERYIFSTFRLGDLDRIPTPLKVVSPVVPAIGLDHGETRTVTVEFYIDIEGNVRMPAVKRSDADDAYAAAAVAAVEQWRFEPPSRKGHPVLVSAQQDFTFVTKP